MAWLEWCLERVLECPALELWWVEVQAQRVHRDLTSLHLQPINHDSESTPPKISISVLQRSIKNTDCCEIGKGPGAAPWHEFPKLDLGGILDRPATQRQQCR
jgi:hypothetical protein